MWSPLCLNLPTPTMDAARCSVHTAPPGLIHPPHTHRAHTGLDRPSVHSHPKGTYSTPSDEAASQPAPLSPLQTAAHCSPPAPAARKHPSPAFPNARLPARDCNPKRSTETRRFFSWCPTPRPHTRHQTPARSSLTELPDAVTSRCNRTAREEQPRPAPHNFRFLTSALHPGNCSFPIVSSVGKEQSGFSFYSSGAKYSCDSPSLSFPVCKGSNRKCGILRYWGE